MNSCAYVAAIDAMTGNTTFRHLTIQDTDEPDLTSALKKNIDRNELHGRTRALMRRLQSIAPNVLNTRLDNTEDPYLIIQAIRRLLLPYNREFVTEPLLKASCGKEDCPMVMVDLEYSRDPATGRYRLKPP